jgi:hypothetical protein
MTEICITLYILGAAASAMAIADADPSRRTLVFVVLLWPILTSAIIGIAIAMVIGAWRKSRQVKP